MGESEGNWWEWDGVAVLQAFARHADTLAAFSPGLSQLQDTKSLQDLVKSPLRDKGASPGVGG